MYSFRFRDFGGNYESVIIKNLNNDFLRKIGGVTFDLLLVTR